MSNASVITGPWINWSQGAVVGATWTTTGSHGFLLVSFLTLFVRMAGGHFWSILCFVLHQLKSTAAPQDGLHHQHQLLLRNSQNHTSTLWDLIKVAVYWRSNAKHSFLRTLPLITIAFLHLTIFTAASLFSSHVASTSNEVLVESPNCGYMVFPDVDFTALQNTDTADNYIYRRTSASTSLNYARACYTTDTTPQTKQEGLLQKLTPKQDSSCNGFATPQIYSNYSYTDCPFSSEMCIDPSNGAYQADSGLINSNAHLGINSPKSWSVNYRRVTTCSPLVTDGFTSFVHGDSTDLPGDNFYGFEYGPNIDPGYNGTYTFGYDMYSANETNSAYFINSYFASLGDIDGSDFIPIPQLNRTDADVTLIMLENWALYTEPVTDLFFNAPQADGSYYRPRFPVSVMGCIEQHQFCNPSTGDCTIPTGMTALGNIDLIQIGFNKEQLAIARHVYVAITNNDLSYMVNWLGTAALQASLSLTNAQGVHSAPLPPLQWVQEVWGWHSFLMAHLQRLIYDYAAGPSNPAFNRWITPPNATDRAVFDVCSHTKIRDPNFYNFSLLGLMLILVVGAATVALNMCLSTVVGLIQRFTKKGLHCRDDWNLDHSLQVQRMAYENARLGHWKGREALVPVTLLGERFGKPTVGGVDPTATSPLFSPSQGYSPYTTISQDGYPFLKPEQDVGITVREGRY